MTDNEIWEKFKEELMGIAVELNEGSTMDMFDQDELGHKLGMDTTNKDQKGRLSEAVGELVEEGRLRSRSKNAEYLSLEDN